MNALDRFVTAQAGGVYEAALAELMRGTKAGHWMWFVFPQIAGLGRSAMAQQYAVRDLAEAQAYIAHPLLGPRLVATAEAVLAHSGRRSAEAMLGGIDAVKLRSSATLFEAAGGGGVFAALLDTLYGGKRDAATLAMIANG